MTTHKYFAFTVILGSRLVLQAQAPAVAVQLDPTTKQMIQTYREDIKVADRKDHALDALTNLAVVLPLVQAYAAQVSAATKNDHDVSLAKVRQAGSNYEQRRIDKTVGASAGGGATTSALSKTGTTDLFSAALENGALTRTQEGTGTTFRVNAYGVYSLFKPPAGNCSITNPLCDSNSELTLRGLSATLTIDNSGGQSVVPVTGQTTTGTSTTPLGIVGQGGRISAVGGQFELLRRSRIGSADYPRWSAAIATAQSQAEAYSTALANTQVVNPQVKTVFLPCIQNSFTPDADQSALEKVYAGCIEQFYQAIAGAPADFIADLTNKRDAYNKALDKALRDLLFKPQATIEYTHNRPANQPSLSTFRFIVDWKFWDSGNSDPQGSLTLNSGFDLYETIPAGVKAGKFRDAQAALELDRKIGKVTWQNRPVVSLAGYYQYQKEKSILQFDNQSQTPIVPIPLPQPASILLDTVGGIGIVQAKVTIPITGAISVPLAVSWANRTELLKASEVRGQFGISFDLDKLLGK